MEVFFDEHYVGAEYAFDTTRKAQHIANAERCVTLSGTDSPRGLRDRGHL